MLAKSLANPRHSVSSEPLSRVAAAVVAYFSRRPMATQRQKHLVLILAREFASNLSTPTLVTDADGNLVFYNEAAEGVIGQPLLRDGRHAARRLARRLRAEDARVGAAAARASPGADRARPAAPLAPRYLVTSADGVEREIEVTAFPLFAHTDEFVGVVVIFWRD